mgnify:FL=1
MNTYPPTTLLPYYPYSSSTNEIDIIIFDLWNEHLMLEWSGKINDQALAQHLHITAAVIEYWESVITKINKDEVQKRRSISNKDS